MGAVVALRERVTSGIFVSCKMILRVEDGPETKVVRGEGSQHGETFVIKTLLREEKGSEGERGKGRRMERTR